MRLLQFTLLALLANVAAGGDKTPADNVRKIVYPYVHEVPPHAILKREYAIQRIALSPDGTRLACTAQTDQASIVVFDVATQQEVCQLGQRGPRQLLHFSPNGKLLATVQQHRGDAQDRATGRIALWDLATKTERAFDHGLPVWAVAFSADGTMLASLACKQFAVGEIKLWDVASGRLLQTLPAAPSFSDHDGRGPGTINLAFSVDGLELLAGNAHNLKVWDIKQGKLQGAASRKGNERSYGKLVFAVGSGPWRGGTVVEVGPRPGRPTLVDFWCDAVTPDAAVTAHSSHQLGAAATTITETRLSHDRARLYYPYDARDGYAVLSANGRVVAGIAKRHQVICLWQLERMPWKVMKPAFQPHDAFAYSLALHPSGDWLAMGGSHVPLLVGLKVGMAEYQLDTLRATQPYGTVWKGQVAFSPDGSKLATTTERGQVALWDTATVTAPVPKSNLPTVTGYVVAAHPRGLLVVGERNGHIVYRAGKSGKTVSQAAHGERVVALAFRADGKQLASGGMDGVVKIWDVAEDGQSIAAQERLKLTHGKHVHRVAFHPNGKVLASGGDGGTVRLWELETGKEIRQLGGHKDWAAVAFNPDGTLLATAGSDQKIQLWDVRTGEVRRTLPGNGAGANNIFGLTFSPDGKTLLSVGDNAHAFSWDVATGKNGYFAKIPIFGVCVAYSPDGRYVAIGGLRAKQNANVPAVVLQEAATNELLHVFEGRSGGEAVYALAFDPTGTRIAAACVDHKGGSTYLAEFDLMRHVPRLVLPGRQKDNSVVHVKALAFSPDGGRVVTGDAAGAVRVWDSANGALLATHEGAKGEVRAVAFQPRGTLLATAESERSIVQLWDAQKHGAAGEIEVGAGKRVHTLAFTPDGALLAVATNSEEEKGPCELWLWDVAQHKLHRKLLLAQSSVRNLVFRADGKYLFVGPGVSLWDTSTWKMEVYLMSGEKNIPEVPVCLALSPDGQTLAVYHVISGLVLWDVPQLLQQPVPRPR